MRTESMSGSSPRVAFGLLLAAWLVAASAPAATAARAATSAPAVAATTYEVNPANTRCPCAYPAVNNTVTVEGRCGTAGNPFSCLSDGVNKAATGDMVSAAPGTYDECLRIAGKTNLTVQSQVPRGAVIRRTYSHAACIRSDPDSGRQSAVEIDNSSGVQLKGFKVTGASAQGIFVHGTGAGNELDDVEVYGNRMGILFYSGGDTLRDSSVHDNAGNGIELKDAPGTRLLTVSSTGNGGTGLTLDAGSDQTVVTGLTASHNGAVGVYLISNRNAFTALTANDNEAQGIYVRGSSNTVAGGELARNRSGILLYCGTSPCVTEPTGNHFSSLEVHHSRAGDGVKLEGGTGTWINAFRIHHNAWNGMLETHEARSTLFEYNEVDNNGGPELPQTLLGHGLYLGGQSSTMRGNKIHDNAGFGIHLWASPWGTATEHYIVERNDVYRNDSGVVLGGSNVSPPNLRELPRYTEIRYNTIHHNTKSGFWYLLSTCTGADNVGNTFHHNTVAYNDAIGGSQIWITNAHGTQLLFKDNIIVGSRSDHLIEAIASNVEANASDGNLFYRVNGDPKRPNIIKWNGAEFSSLSGVQPPNGVPSDRRCPAVGGSTTPIEAHSTYAAPSFLDGTMNLWREDPGAAPHNGNFHLMPGSPGTTGGVCCAETGGGTSVGTDIDGEMPACSPVDCVSAATGAGADWFRDTDGDGIADKYDCDPRSASNAAICGDVPLCTGDDADRDGYFVAAPGCAPALSDCNDADPTIHAGMQEICDGKDNDCNGVADDMGKTTCGIGACRATVDNCVDRVLIRCVPGTPGIEGLTAAATCFDGIDNDCDGSVDDDCGADIDARDGQLVGPGVVASGSPADLSATSANDTYEKFDETPGSGSDRRLTVVWTITNPAGGFLYDLGVEGYRAYGNDDYVFSATTRASGSCTSGDGKSSPLLVLSKPQDDDQTIFASLDSSGPVTCIRVEDTLTSNDATTDRLALDRLILFPTPVADSETAPGPGSIVSGSRTDTFTSDDIDEVLVETRVGSGYQLAQTWRFDHVPAGPSHGLNLEGHRSTGGGDGFQFSYSTDDVHFIDIGGAEINTVSDRQQGTDFTFGGSTLAGTVWIRVRDESATNPSPTTLSIDRLAIKTRQR